MVTIQTKSTHTTVSVLQNSLTNMYMHDFFSSVHVLLVCATDRASAASDELWLRRHVWVYLVRQRKNTLQMIFFSPNTYFAIHSCKVVKLSLFRWGVCPVASQSTVYLLWIALLLLPAHVCLGLWDRSPGPIDHTCGERELSTHSSSSLTTRGKKGNTHHRWTSAKYFWTQMCTQLCMKKCTKFIFLLKLLCFLTAFFFFLLHFRWHCTEMR